MVKNQKVFLDTNIVADILDCKRTRHQESLRLVEKLIEDDWGICISEDMISTLFYISKDKKQILEFFQNVVFIDWEVACFGKNLLEQAVAFALLHSTDLEDVMQCLCAKQNNCACLITNDVKFCDCGIEVFDAGSFLKA